MRVRTIRVAVVGAALAASLAFGRLAQAQVGDRPEDFEQGPMVTQGQVQYLEPFSLRNHAINGVTYRATDSFHKACQIMLVVQSGTISSEIFAIPVVSEAEVLRAQRVLLDAFLLQSGLADRFHPRVREQMLQAMEDGQQVRQVGGFAIQALLIQADVPLLVVAIARDLRSLPLPRPKIEGTVQQ